MEPLSRRTRTVYLGLFMLVFIVFVPLTLLYSSGYRLGEGLKLVKTGGIYVGLDESNANLFLDGKLVKEVGILKRGFFVQDLTPRVYHVEVKKDGYREWQKVIEVKPQHVSETSAFVLPDNIPYVEVIPSDPRYKEVLALFATSTETTLFPNGYPDVLSTSTRNGKVTDVKQKGDIILWREGESIFARWTNDNSNAPSYFCENGVCDKEILLDNGSVQFFDFHPLSNELLLMVKGSIVFMTEIDPRIPRNTETLYDAPGVVVRTLENSIFMKETKKTGVHIFEFKL